MSLKVWSKFLHGNEEGINQFFQLGLSDFCISQDLANVVDPFLDFIFLLDQYNPHC